VLVGLYVVVLGFAAVVRPGDGAPATPDEASAGVPVASSANWLADHDYRVMARLVGRHRTINLTVVRRGDVVRGDVQTLDAHGARHTDYYRFRIEGGRIVTATTDGSGSVGWQRATPSQSALLGDVADSDWALQTLRASSLRDLGSAGDAEM
jgi:hypothetical protein